MTKECVYSYKYSYIALVRNVITLDNIRIVVTPFVRTNQVEPTTYYLLITSIAVSATY